MPSVKLSYHTKSAKEAIAMSDNIIQRKEMEKKYFTYMVRCQDGTLYTGFTVDDPEKRVAVHNAGKGAKYTKGRRPVRLVWYREWNNGHDARSCEFYLKRKTKQEKEALAASFGKDTD